MRLTKRDPALAETYVKKAVAGGLMQSNADNAVLKHSSLYINYNGYMFSGREYATFYMTKNFINHLKSTNDPRLPIYAMRYVGALSGAQFTKDRLTSDPAKMIGMPLGYNDVTIASQYAIDGVVSRFDYSLANINTVLQASSPEYFVTYGQTQLLLAEAVHRGWVTGDASAIFANAIRANLRQLADYGSAAVVDQAKIDAYVLANPLTAGKELAQINTEYWVASFLNGPELWANFRRSDLPALTPNPYPSSETPGDFIHRLPYLTNEYVVNGANVAEAVARQGIDIMLTRVWWDKK
jgi:dimeric dUTPase (all-alpha-NTP-PPase superfamily)